MSERKAKAKEKEEISPGDVYNYQASSTDYAPASDKLRMSGFLIR